MAKRAGNVVVRCARWWTRSAATRPGSSSSRAAPTRSSTSTSSSRSAQTLDNPVFYVQYGHARLAAILREGGGGRPPGPAFDLEVARTLDRAGGAGPHQADRWRSPTSSPARRSPTSRTGSRSGCRRRSRRSTRYYTRGSGRGERVIGPDADEDRGAALPVPRAEARCSRTGSPSSASRRRSGWRVRNSRRRRGRLESGGGP